MRGHSCGKPSEKLKRVRKQNCNEGRLFWSCARAGCHASFSWADATFPKCRCDAVSRLRVTKNGNNAGKWFFACSKGRDAACGFFQWADAAVLEKAQGQIQGGEEPAVASAHRPSGYLLPYLGIPY